MNRKNKNDKKISIFQGLEPVLGTDSGRNPINLKKGFQNQFLGTLNFKKGSRTLNL
jgi:hypothetical protein